MKKCLGLCEKVLRNELRLGRQFDAKRVGVGYKNLESVGVKIGLALV